MENPSMSLSSQELWTLMKSYYREEGLVRQHLDSYNYFIEYNIQAIIDETGEISIDVPDYPFKVKLRRLEIGRPRVIEVDGSDHPIYPMEAYRRGLMKVRMWSFVKMVNPRQLRSSDLSRSPIGS